MYRQRGFDIGGAAVYTKEGKELSEAEKESLTCASCHLLLRDPQQVIQCGHRFCRTCVEIVFVGSDLKCPIDHEPVLKEQIRKDRGCANEINSLLMDCKFWRRGCQWRSLVIKFEDHLSKCLFADVKCSYCGILVVRNTLPVHEADECLKRPVPCPYCEQPQPFDQREEHTSVCLYVRVRCSQCHEMVPKKELDDHMLDDCIEAIVKCCFCDFEGKLEEVNDHYCKRHLHRIAKFSFLSKKPANPEEGVLLSPDHRFDPPLNSNPRSMVERDSAFGKTADHQYGVGNPQTAVSRLDGGDTSTQYSYTSSLDTSETSSSFSSSVVPVPSGLVEVQSTVQILQKEKAQLKEEKAQLKEEMEGLKERVEKQHSQLAGVIDKIQTVQESVTRHALTMEEIKLRQDILDVKTATGIFIWKIPDIKKRYRDALDRRTLSLYSPPFHTSPHGYRMCVRAYLNGDGSGKTTHMSVFFVLMRSEHDSLLPWPFKQAVTFLLVNQRDYSKSVTETFLPDLQSPSFQQPHSEMNIASGFPRFVPQSYLKNEDFIKGNAIYIKCKVDLTGLTNE